MNELVIAALRRKREAFEKAGDAERVKSIDARLAEVEEPKRQSPKKPEPAAAAETDVVFSPSEGLNVEPEAKPKKPSTKEKA